MPPSLKIRVGYSGIGGRGHLASDLRQDKKGREKSYTPQALRDHLEKNKTRNHAEQRCAHDFTVYVEYGMTWGSHEFLDGVL